LFIPASRSFFANIEKNIFSLISSKFELDPLMAEFGAALERARMFTQLGRRHAGPRDGIVTDWSEIIHGDYLFDGKDEFILSDKRRIRIANSSSGQQEVIPLLLMLRHSDAVARNPASGISYSIEEPEAHLFPSAQKAVAFRLARELNESVFNRVLVTTHSPYILTAFNNLILAGKLLEAGLSRESIKEVLPPECCVSPSAVAAYKVIDGQVIPIIDSATKLVNSYLIDEISSEFASEFNQLLDMQHQASK
jgi:hypothetical protein